MKQIKLTLKSGLPTKYYLGLQSIAPGYPSAEDFVFECVNHTSAKDKKALRLDGITFSKSSLKDVFGERLQSTEFLKSLKELIQAMLTDGRLTKPDENSLTIPKETFSTLFNIV